MGKRRASKLKDVENHPFAEALFLVFDLIRPKNVRIVRYDEVVKRASQEHLLRQTALLGEYVAAGEALEAALQGVVVGALYDQLCLFDILGSGENSRRAMQKGKRKKQENKLILFRELYEKIKRQYPAEKDWQILEKVATGFSGENLGKPKRSTMLRWKSAIGLTIQRGKGSLKSSK